MRNPPRRKETKMARKKNDRRIVLREKLVSLVHRMKNEICECGNIEAAMSASLASAQLLKSISDGHVRYERAEWRALASGVGEALLRLMQQASVEIQYFNAVSEDVKALLDAIYSNDPDAEIGKYLASLREPEQK